MSIIDEVVADLTALSDELDSLVAELDDAAWATSTPALGWTIAHQIGHLSWTDAVSVVAATDPDRFHELLQAAAADAFGYVDARAEEAAELPPARLLTDWRDNRRALAQALVAVPAGVKIPWFGPPMSAASMATARMMETWAHGLDVADALGVRWAPTDAIRSVVHLGVRTRDFAYMVNGRQAPAHEFRYEITAPSGNVWEWGPIDSADVIRGSAVDFCSLVTQRRALADLDLEISGDDAHEWSLIAQCFAGPPGGGRAPLSDESATDGSGLEGSGVEVQA